MQKVIGHLATPLFVKIAGAVFLALIVALGIAAALYQAERNHSRKVEGQLSKANALIEVQNEAVANLEAEGKELRANVERARKEGEAGIRRADRLASELEKERPLSGECRTPEQVLRAGL